MERMATAAAKPVKKAVSDVVQDVADSFGLADKPKQVPNDQKQQIKQDDQAKAAQIRRNIANINAQIAEIRKKKEHESRRVEEHEKQAKKQEKVEKKKEESVLAKIIKSQKGTKEGMQRVSG